MNDYKRVAFILLFCCVLRFPITAQQRVSIATLDWQPYISRELEGYGYVGELITEAFSRSGYQTFFLFLPWARVVSLAEEGQVDSYGPEYYSPGLNEKYIVSNPFPGGPAGLFALVSDNIRFNSLEELSEFQIGVVRGYTNEEEFDNAEYLDKQEVTSDLQNIRKLLAKRIDLFFSDKLVVEYQSRKYGLDISQIEMVKVLAQHDLFLCFPKQLPNAQTLADDFNDGLDAMEMDGTLDDIMEKHGF